MKIGIPTEIKSQESRVAMTPAGVMELVHRYGHQVYVQKGAGAASQFSDEAYISSGAIMLDTIEEVYQTAEMKDGLPNSNSTYKEFAGKMRSQGVELDITGNPYPNLSIIAGASYNHSVYLDTPADFGYVENQRLVRTPATTANASVFYTFTDYVKGLKLGASAYYVGGRIAGWNDTKKTLNDRDGVSRFLEVGNYMTAAVSIGYDWNKFSVMGKVGNLFDTIDYNYHENYSVNPITPRNFYVTLTYKL